MYKTAEPIIEFKNVTKTYGDKVVLDNVSIKISGGEFVSVIGKSGCGKTTFMKLINALLTPDSGEIFVYGENISNVDKTALRRNIGYVIQSIGLFPHMTVRKNIEYVPSLSKEMRGKAVAPEKLMDIVSMEHEYLDVYPDSLSGGQKQRIGIARALSVMPDILLMDEPFAAADEVTRRQLQKSLAEIHSKLNNTVIFVTHSIQEALYLGTSVMIIENGKIVQFDTPENVLKNPATDLVKELTGGA